jgi:hypothetical protein
LIETPQFPRGGFHSTINNQQSAISNQQSKIGNRKSDTAFNGTQPDFIPGRIRFLWTRPKFPDAN